MPIHHININNNINLWGVLMKKMLFYFLCVSVIVFITIIVVYLSEKDNRRNISFLKSYGWEVSREAIENEEIKIPETFEISGCTWYNIFATRGLYSRATLL